MYLLMYCVIYTFLIIAQKLTICNPCAVFCFIPYFYSKCIFGMPHLTCSVRDGIIISLNYVDFLKMRCA